MNYTGADAMLLWRDEKWPPWLTVPYRLACYFCAYADAAVFGYLEGAL